MEKGFQYDTVVVTGGASGIGKAFVRNLQSLELQILSWWICIRLGSV